MKHKAVIACFVLRIAVKTIFLWKPRIQAFLPIAVNDLKNIKCKHLYNPANGFRESPMVWCGAEIASLAFQGSVPGMNKSFYSPFWVME